MALHQMGYSPQGIRIDSGDLAYLSRTARAAFEKIAAQYADYLISNLLNNLR